ncbi:helix-turn-helix transcriptional regulator [Aquisalibacillus elongatus]|uniref:Transcriptional regulator with XRE-family HTH domain n=1 Tax=Aquisalibacillus elongatus TaxID=485577 RepID=A0A3N5B470_9BACI|nr:helix-turn-helix transcriptional regulator [Aquisalibacillus elongatus]RPF52204.1 transcriptional regulator with XRE-family HTH domain [Aquisalibacillus elongatus]
MENVSENIQYYRKIIGMTRKELADGICDPSTLFRIEKGEQMPRIDVLTAICHKLMVPIDFMVSHLSNRQLSEIEKYKRLCREATYHGDFHSLSIILEEFKNFMNNLDDGPEIHIVKRFIKWHDAIYSHEAENDLMKAQHILKEIYNGHIYTELDIGICNSLGYIKIYSESIDFSMPYFKAAHNALNKLPYVSDKTLPSLVGYNLAYCYYYQWNLDEAITVCYQVLEHLEMNQLIYKLGDTKHMLAKIHQRLGEYELAHDLLKQSIHLFHIEANTYKHNKSIKDLQDLEELMGIVE